MEQIASKEQLEKIIKESEKPIYIFKHSTRCPISAGAYQEVSKYLGEQEALPIYLILVIENREESNQAAEILNVPHESPQVIKVENGKATFDMSHQSITVEALREHQ